MYVETGEKRESLAVRGILSRLRRRSSLHVRTGKFTVWAYALALVIGVSGLNVRCKLITFVFIVYYFQEVQFIKAIFYRLLFRVVY